MILEADEGGDIGRDDAFEDLTRKHDRGGEAADAHPIDGNDLVLLAESDGEESLTVPRGALFAQKTRRC